jgi:hypothetical protein
MICFISPGNYDCGWDRILVTHGGYMSCGIYHHWYLEFFMAGFCLFTVVFVQISEHKNWNISINVFYRRNNYEILLRRVDYSIMMHKGVCQIELFQCNFKIFSLILDFKISPCSWCCMFSFGWFPGVCFLYIDVSELFIRSIFIGAYEDGTDKEFRNVGI